MVDWFNLKNRATNTMKVTFPKDDGDEGGTEAVEPKWLTQFYKDHAVTYIVKRCDFLMEAGRYLDTEAIHKEFDY